MIKYPDQATANLAVMLIFRKGNRAAFVLRGHTGWMDGYYGLPGGRVEPGESYTDAALREAEEEVGVKLSKQQLRPVVTLQRHHEDSDWVDIAFEVTTWEGELYNAEPDKHDEVAWLDLNNLPDNLVPFMAILNSYKDGTNYIEYGWDQG